MRSFFVIPILALLSSCSFFDANDTSKIELDRSWEIEQFFSTDDKQITLNEDEPLTIRFSSENELSGEADCNVFGGEYRAKENGDLAIKYLVATEIACEEPTLGYEYLEALSEVTDFERKNGQLMLFYGENGSLIFLERLE